MIALILSGFMLKAILAGVSISILTGPLGSVLIWRRMAYFGDTLAHSALLGLSFAIILNLNLYLGLIFISLLVAVALQLISRYKFIANDAILGILSHTALASGLIIATKFYQIRLNLLGYLFGDILAVQTNELIIIACSIIPISSLVYFFWNKIVATTISVEIAICEHVNTRFIEWLIIWLLAIVFAISIKIVGILLINALLIIPAASARIFAKSPEQMAGFATVFGMVGVIVGMILSLQFDLPAGPAIICVLAMCFVVTLLLGHIKQKTQQTRLS